MIDLDAGERLIALRQNHEAGNADFPRGTAVAVRWHPEHVIAVPDSPINEGAVHA